MRTLFVAAALTFLQSFVKAETYTTCLAQGARIGMTDVPTSSTDQTDFTMLQTQERDTFKFKLKQIRVCNGASGRLARIQATADKVFTDTTQAPISLELNAYGNANANYNCEDLIIDYANGEYLSKISMSWINNDSVRKITLTTSSGNVLTKGTYDGSDKLESGELDFNDDTTPVGLQGMEGQYFWQKLGAITVDSDCLVGAEIPSIPKGDKQVEETKTNNVVMLVAIIVPIVVVLLLIMAVGGWCLYKKQTHVRDQKGTEVVSVSKTRTRPQTPPKDTAKAQNEPQPQVHTDEEDMKVQDVNVDNNTAGGNADYEKLQSMNDKPNINV